MCIIKEMFFPDDGIFPQIILLRGHEQAHLSVIFVPRDAFYFPPFTRDRFHSRPQGTNNLVTSFEVTSSEVLNG